MAKARQLAGLLVLLALVASGSACDPTSVDRATGLPTSAGVSADAALPGASVTPTALSTGPFDQVWTALPLARRRVALTFDCGGSAAGVPSVLATLQQQGVARATFFMTGDWVRAFPAEATELANRGYLIGNHTEHHVRLTGLTDADVRAEVRRGRRTVLAATGVDPKPWFRFPYGAYDSRTLGVVNSAGWVAIGWTVDTLGWQGTSGGQSVDSVVQRVVQAARPGAIVLMHVGANPKDGTTLDADALPRVIEALRADGYRFTTPKVLLRP